jgi:anaerobic ribonucleoside-triphosphate reductase
MPSDMKDVRLTYKNGCRIAKIRVGKEWVDRGLEKIPRKDRTAYLIQERDSLQAKYNKQHNVDGTSNTNNETGTPTRSFKEDVIEEIAAWKDRQQLRNPDNYDSAFNHVWEVLGNEANKNTKGQSPKSFAKLRVHWLESGLSTRTIQLYAKHTREILTKLVHKRGLKPECVDELKNIRRQGVSEASGEAFRQSHLKIILELVRIQSELIQILVWIGLSGGPQIVDAVFLPLIGVDWESGLITYRRVKTNEIIQFAALPPLLELLKRRRDRFGPGAVYALPELIFMVEEIKDPKCNHVNWAKVPQDVAVRGAANGIKAINEFLTACKIKTKEITYKSFRKGNISFWASIGIKLKTRMRMAGHTREEAHNRYDTPSEPEILQASKITWDYLEAIREGRPFFIPTGPYDIYKTMEKHWEAFPTIIREMIENELYESFGRLMTLIDRRCGEQQSRTESNGQLLLRAFSESAEALSKAFQAHEQRVEALIRPVVTAASELAGSMKKILARIP